MHEITVIIGVVIRDRTAGNADRPWYRVPTKFNILALVTETTKHTYTQPYNHIHAHISTHTSKPTHTYMQPCIGPTL